MRPELKSLLPIGFGLAVLASVLVSANALALATDNDPATAIRGSLGGSLEDLSLNGNLGTVSFYLNGGFALLFILFAVLLVIRRRRNRKPSPSRTPQRSPRLYSRINFKSQSE